MGIDRDFTLIASKQNASKPDFASTRLICWIRIQILTQERLAKIIKNT